MHDPWSGYEGYIDADGIVKGASSSVAVVRCVASDICCGTNRMVASSPSSKRPLAARSVMSVISGLLCEGKWLERELGGGVWATELYVTPGGVA